MGCGCKDIEQDQKIIEYYNNKKMMENNKSVFDNQIYTSVSWEGKICDVTLFVPNEDSIIKIERMENQWIAYINKSILINNNDL